MGAGSTPHQDTAG